MKNYIKTQALNTFGTGSAKLQADKLNTITKYYINIYHFLSIILGITGAYFISKLIDDKYHLIIFPLLIIIVVSIEILKSYFAKQYYPKIIVGDTSMNIFGIVVIFITSLFLSGFGGYTINKSMMDSKESIVDNSKKMQIDSIKENSNIEIYKLQLEALIKKTPSIKNNYTLDKHNKSILKSTELYDNEVKKVEDALTLLNSKSEKVINKLDDKGFIVGLSIMVLITILELLLLKSYNIKFEYLYNAYLIIKENEESIVDTSLNEIKPRPDTINDDNQLKLVENTIESIALHDELIDCFKRSLSYKKALILYPQMEVKVKRSTYYTYRKQFINTGKLY
jgi:hypothetical protein